MGVRGITVIFQKPPAQVKGVLISTTRRGGAFCHQTAVEEVPLRIYSPDWKSQGRAGRGRHNGCGIWDYSIYR
jgi:hypothetical protein